MNKQLTFEYEEKAYTLEFTKETVRMMEARGFDVNEITRKPNTLIPMLFNSAFQANHRGIKNKLTDEIFASLESRDQLISKLIEMYNEPLNELVGDETEDEGKNLKWAANWE